MFVYHCLKKCFANIVVRRTEFATFVMEKSSWLTLAEVRQYRRKLSLNSSKHGIEFQDVNSIVILARHHATETKWEECIPFRWDRFFFNTMSSHAHIQVILVRQPVFCETNRPCILVRNVADFPSDFIFKWKSTEHQFLKISVIFLFCAQKWWKLKITILIGSSSEKQNGSRDF